jgi:DNA-binding ferritin-like protein
MSQNDSLPVLDPTRIAIPPDICTYLTTLLHQTLAGTVELPSNVAQSSWDAQGKDVFLLQTVFAAMTAALDAYTDLVAAHLPVLGRVAAGHSPHGGYSSEAASISRRQGGG